MKRPMRKGFTLIELMIVVAIIAIIAAIAIPGLLRARIASNERNASTSLKVMVSCEELWKGNDVDRNGIMDYWTGDVAGMYCIGFTSTNRAVAVLSDLGMAFADTFRYDEAGGTFQGLDFDDDGNPDTTYDPIPIVGSARAPKTGYWYQVMLNNEMGQPYQIDTDNNGPCHSHGQYGFCALPADYDSTGNYCFIVNNVGSVFRRDFGINTVLVNAGVQVTTFDNAGVPLDWPMAADLGAKWGKVE